MTIPRSVLSEHFQDRLSGYRVVGALFLTFEFDPGFFEQQILPVVLDVPVSHAEVARLLQLESALRDLEHGVAVFYDHQGLRAFGNSAPRLQVDRIPLRLGTGIFHTKNVLLLAEKKDAEVEHPGPTLFVACLSANLTRTGWWENVEACHVEQLEQGEQTLLQEPLRILLNRVSSLSANERTQGILAPYRKFIGTLQPRGHRSSQGRLYPQMFVGGESLTDWLGRSLTGDAIRYLEVISPFFDKTAESGPFKALLDKLAPKEALVYLPRRADGTAECAEEFYDALSQLDGVSWATLPEELVKLGKGADAGHRSVHAKVYRFFRPQPKREVIFVGSVNLTQAAHGTGGNFESGFLIEVDPARRPDFWLKSDKRRPTEFRAPTALKDDPVIAALLPIELRFSWKDTTAWTRWSGRPANPELVLEAHGEVLADPLEVTKGQWRELSAEISAGIGQRLRSTSILHVRLDGGDPSPVLVQEEDMALKPELRSTLPVRDILEYWALLKPEQRQAFMEDRASELADGEMAALMAPVAADAQSDDMFARCAGVFHSFGMLEQSVDEALKHDPPLESRAVALVFGERFDSLGTVLRRVLSESGEFGDAIDRYLVLMCATQLCQEVRAQHPEFWSKHQVQAARIETLLSARSQLREEVMDSDRAGLVGFMDWFDKQFLQRAVSVDRR